MTKIIAVAGSEIEKPQYCRVVAGARVDSILRGNVKPQKEGDHVRIISGKRAHRHEDPGRRLPSVSMPISLR